MTYDEQEIIDKFFDGFDHTSEIMPRFILPLSESLQENFLFVLPGVILLRKFQMYEFGKEALMDMTLLSDTQNTKISVRSNAFISEKNK